MWGSQMQDDDVAWEWSNINCIVDPQEDVGGLYLGNIEGAKLEVLRKHKISAVLTVAAGTELKYDKKDIPNHKIIDAEDWSAYDLSKHFDAALEFIKEHIAKGNVYVHCFAGVSRSATIVIAHLMKEKKLPLKETIKYVKSKRSMISPNRGFLEQLEKYEAILAIEAKIPEK